MAVLGLESGEDSVVPETKHVANSSGSAPVNSGEDASVTTAASTATTSTVAATTTADETADDMDEFERMLLNS